MEYKIDKTRKYFVRNDSSTAVIMMKDTNEEFILNASGFNIFNLIMKFSDDKIVLEEISKIYKNVNIELLKKDIENIMNLLFIYGIINKKDHCKKDINNGVSAVDQNQYKKICDFINNNKDSRFLFNNSKEYYTPYNIRYRVMNNLEYYYSKVSNSSYDCVCAITPNIKNTSVVLMTTVIFNKLSPIEKMISDEREIIEYIKNKMINEVNKFRFQYFSKDDEIPIFLDLQEKVGFEIECKLKKEYLNNNLIIYKYDL